MTTTNPYLAPSVEALHDRYVTLLVATLRAEIARLTLDNERLRADLGHMLRERIQPLPARTGPPRRLP